MLPGYICTFRLQSRRPFPAGLSASISFEKFHKVRAKIKLIFQSAVNAQSFLSLFHIPSTSTHAHTDVSAIRRGAKRLPFYVYLPRGPERRARMLYRETHTRISTIQFKQARLGPRKSNNNCKVWIISSRLTDEKERDNALREKAKPCVSVENVFIGNLLFMCGYSRCKYLKTITLECSVNMSKSIIDQLLCSILICIEFSYLFERNSLLKINLTPT